MRSSLTVFAATFFLSRALSAQTTLSASDAAQRRMLIAEAESAQREGQHDRALQRALDASAIQASPSLLRFIADEYAALGRVRQAYQNATTCYREAEASPALNNREAIMRHCQGLQTQLRLRAGWVQLRGIEEFPPPARVLIEGELVPQEQLRDEVMVRPGFVTIAIEVPGERAWEWRVPVREQSHVAVPLPQAPHRASTPAPPPPPSLAAREVNVRGPGPVPWVLVGVGAAAIVGAAITYATVVPDADEQLTTLCNNTINGVRFCGANSSTAAPYFASRSRALTATNVLLGAGGAAIVGGLLWYLLSPRRTRVEVRAGWTPEAAVLGIGGRF